MNSDELQGRGYTCCSMRSTDRRWRRRIGCTCTVREATSGSAATTSVDSVAASRPSGHASTASPSVDSRSRAPRDLGVALAEVQRSEVTRLLELLALDAGR